MNMTNALFLLIAVLCASMTPVGASALEPPADPTLPGHWPAEAQQGAAQQAPPRPEQLAAVRLLADRRWIEPGETFHLAIIFELVPHWHIYWLNPGDSGAPTEIEVTAPDGFEIGSTLYPRPATFQTQVGKTYGYEGRTVLLVPVTAPKELDAPTISFSANIFYFVCRDICLMGEADRTIELAVRGDPPRSEDETRSADDELIVRYRQRLPRDLDELDGAQVRAEGDRVVVTGPLRGHDSVQFFPVHTEEVRFGQTRLETSGDQFVLTIDIERSEADSQMEEARGLIGLGKQPDGPAYWFTLPTAVEKEGAS